MFVAAKIMDSFLDGTLPDRLSQYNYLIDRVELETSASVGDLTYYEANTRLIDTLEVRCSSQMSRMTVAHLSYSLRSLKQGSETDLTPFNSFEAWPQFFSRLLPRTLVYGQASTGSSQFLSPIYLLRVVTN